VLDALGVRRLPGIGCPVLAIQGRDDEYGTTEQLDRLARGARDAPGVETLELAGCGHAPHRDQPDEVLAAIARFVAPLA
jgi:pimeloyl-ACP methyl ester carboxylesterase